MWNTNANKLTPQLSTSAIDWLTKPYNLSNALKKVCRDLSVSVLCQGMDTYRDDEARYLKAEDASRCYVRQVLLVGDGQPFCFARIVAPYPVYQQYQSQFDSLNGRLLGNTLLYSNPKTTRSVFEFTGLSDGHPYFNFAREALPDSYALESPLPARRSLFHMNAQHPLLVTEVFLTGIPAYPEVFA